MLGNLKLFQQLEQLKLKIAFWRRFFDTADIITGYIRQVESWDWWNFIQTTV